MTPWGDLPFSTMATFVPLAVGCIFALVGGLMLVGALRAAYRGRHWPRTQAELVSATQERRTTSDGDGGSRTTYALVAHYRYRHPATGQPVEGRQDVPGGMVVSPGTPFEVAYDPADPSRSLLPQTGVLAPACSSLFALFFLLLGLAIAGIMLVVVLR